VRLFYDNKCSLCKFFKLILSFFDIKRKIKFLPLRNYYESFYIILEDGKSLRGMEAIPILLEALSPWKILKFPKNLISFLQRIYLKLNYVKVNSKCGDDKGKENL